MCSSVLPAFPFKSPSSKKVLGALPDLAEEIFLRRSVSITSQAQSCHLTPPVYRLEDLCLSVEDIYEHGAKLKIVSDGIVYSRALTLFLARPAFQIC